MSATSGVLAQFGGVNLAFMFIAAFAATNGLITKWLAAIGLDPWNHGWSLYKFWGVAFVYMYFQIPADGSHHHARLRRTAPGLARGGREPGRVARGVSGATSDSRS